MYTSAANTTDTTRGTCDCCRLLRGDQSLKQVNWCGLCKAWLCDVCRKSPADSIRAALKKLRGY
jgi:hypothetical protein